MAGKPLYDISLLIGYPRKGNDTGCRLKKIREKRTKLLKEMILDKDGKDTEYYITVDSNFGKSIIDPNGDLFARIGGPLDAAILDDKGMLTGYSIGGLMGDEIWYHGNRTGKDPIKRKTHPNEI